MFARPEPQAFRTLEISVLQCIYHYTIEVFRPVPDNKKAVHPQMNSLLPNFNPDAYLRTPDA